MENMKLFDAYRKENTNSNGHNGYCDVDYLLRLWKENKAQYLRPLFGDKLILEKKVVYNKGRDLLAREMDHTIRNYREFIDTLVEKLRVAMGADNMWNRQDTLVNSVWDGIKESLYNEYVLVSNELDLGYTDYDDNGPVYVKSYTIEFANGHKIQLQRGMKITRAMSQICKELDMSDEWEKFRISHSQVLNTKKLTGNLCLSIHPLDYATASDNDNGWSSCMSWQDNGCYRMGTVEMMNSPMVICAYLKSDKQYMEIDGETWNSKKWRAWIIVTKDVIVCNRHYPYHSDEIAMEAIAWVKELVGNAYGWTYDETHTDFYQWMREQNCELEFITNYMYNDLGGDDVIGCFKTNWSVRNMPGQICFSGPAECMVCGKEIEKYDIDDSGVLECNECNGDIMYCNDCGCIINEDNCYYDPDGNAICEDCYDRNYANCPNCDTTCDREDMVEINLPIDPKLTEEYADVLRKVGDGWFVEQDYKFMTPVTLCKDCANNMGIAKYTDPETGEILIVPDATDEGTDMRRVMNLFDCPDFERSHRISVRGVRPYWLSDDVDVADYAKVYEYWTKQWEVLKNRLEATGW